ncbi:hypothetical protein CPB84DRAFT_656135 [Gymnopilus junonius]|uniref:Uncharacterized protein n=1 Tax=Gymnopilus junonius TaxID=109634 RepID=A0A9P5NQ57_GYMJU|nr:hypothetical protein CPB84DRAFT_656135 [Gymnopilus junonius]
MASIIRSAKSGNEWTEIEMEAYNIKLAFQDTQAFFGEIPFSFPAVDREVLTAPTANGTLNDAAYNLLAQLDLAMVPTEHGDSAVTDFAVALFHSIGYVHRPRAIHTRKTLRFMVCGEHKDVKPNICIVDRESNDIILVVQEDTYFGCVNPHAQLIAEAIAAFQNNNNRRQMVGLRKCDRKVIPGIIMVGTSPSFFKIPVSQELVRCVERGQYPPTPTIVTGHVPDVPRPDRRFSEGMKPLDSRCAILQCYEAFKRFIF